MKFKTTLSLTCLVTIILASTASYAGTVTTGQLADNYIGANGASAWDVDYSPKNSAAHYDTHWMQVARTINGDQGSLTVNINSNFVAHNDSSSFSFGDLFIMDADNYTLANECTDSDGNAAYGCNEYSESSNGQTSQNTEKSDNKWQYAFDLGVDRANSYDSNIVKSGALRAIDQSNQNTYDAGVKSTTSSSTRQWQAIMVNDSAVSTVNSTGSWGTDIANKLITMTFDISGTSLMDAEQLALRWQMTCANDIIEVVAKLKSTAVPEPSTLMLMLLAGVGIFSSRQKKAAKLKI